MNTTVQHASTGSHYLPPGDGTSNPLLSNEWMSSGKVYVNHVGEYDFIVQGIYCAVGVWYHPLVDPARYLDRQKYRSNQSLSLES